MHSGTECDTAFGIRLKRFNGDKNDPKTGERALTKCLTVVLFNSATDHVRLVLDRMRPPAPKKEGLARDILHAERSVW